FLQQLDQSAPKLAAFGVRVHRMGKNGKEEIRPLRDILDQLADSRLFRGRGSRFRLTQVFGSAEARTFLNTLVDNRQKFEELAESARNANDVQADSQRYLESTAGQLKRAVANARAELEALVTPERLE